MEGRFDVTAIAGGVTDLHPSFLRPRPIISSSLHDHLNEIAVASSSTCGLESSIVRLKAPASIPIIDVDQDTVLSAQARSSRQQGEQGASSWCLHSLSRSHDVAVFPATGTARR